MGFFFGLFLSSFKFFAELAHLVEQLLCKHQVTGSIPVLGSILGCSSMVERLAVNQEVGGSIPFVPAIWLVRLVVRMSPSHGGDMGSTPVRAKMGTHVPRLASLACNQTVVSSILTVSTMFFE